MNYFKEDICKAEISGTSGSTWDISPPNIHRLRQELRKGGDVSMYVAVSFTRLVSTSSYYLLPVRCLLSDSHLTVAVCSFLVRSILISINTRNLVSLVRYISLRKYPFLSHTPPFINFSNIL